MSNKKKEITGFERVTTDCLLGIYDFVYEQDVPEQFFNSVLQELAIRFPDNNTDGTEQ